MQRYFVEQKNWFDQTVIIDGDDYHHIANVMRMELDDEVICNQPNGTAYRCRIDQITDQEIQLFKIEQLDRTAELPIHVTLIQGLPKGDKLDWIVQKTTELGVETIVPLESKRSVVKWDDKKKLKKTARLEKIAKEAAEQSHRRIKPTIEMPSSLKHFLAKDEVFDHKFVAYEEATRQVKTKRLNYYLTQIKPGESLAVVIGPEGGLTDTEIKQLYQNDFLPIRLGPRVLRTETAPLYLLAALSYQFEESD